MRTPARQYRELIDKLGCELVDIRLTGSKHYRIMLRFNGRTRFFIGSGSPSDGRSIKNFRSDVMRWMREGA